MSSNSKKKTKRAIEKPVSNLANMKIENLKFDYEEKLKENGKNMVYDYYAYLECDYEAEKFWESNLIEQKPEVSLAEPDWSDDSNQGDERHNLNDVGYAFLEDKCINSFKKIEINIIEKINNSIEVLKKIDKLYVDISEDLKKVDIEGMNLSEDYQNLSANTRETQKWLNMLKESMKKK